MSTFLVIGEALVDAVVHPDGTAAEHPGGSPANVALGLARLGKRAELLTHLAEDDRGRSVRTHLETSGVVVLPQSFGATRTPTALARLDDDGVATYEFDLSWDLAPVTVGDAVRVVHTGSIGAVAATDPADALLTLLREARATATITYDPNLRPTIMGDPAAVRRDVEALVRVADVVKVSDEDLAWLFPEADPVAVARAWAGGPGSACPEALVIVTRGGDGSTAVLSDGSTVDVPAPRVTVADTVGAGDSYMGGLLAALDDHGLTGAARRDALHRAGAGTLRTVMEHAARIAAVTVSRPGANPPTAAEITTQGSTT